MRSKLGLFLLPLMLFACQPKEEKSHVIECGMTEKELSQAQLAGRMMIDFHPIGGDRVCAAFATDPLAKPEKKTYKVYRDFDDPTRGIRAQLYSIAAKNPDLVKLEVLGHSHQNREVIAMKLTSPATTKGRRGQVLYVGLHHAREWVTADLMMRWLNHLVAGAAQDPEIQLLLRQTEIWLVPILNPDGYQYTFDTNRMWRKNLRDNDGDGAITEADGVDLNRNYDFQWGFDEYGASDKIRSGSYRGPAPFSEPETAALRDLIEREKFVYGISFHSFGNLILYPAGYRPFLTTPDEPLFEYLAGKKEKSAIYDTLGKSFYRPGPGSSLYTTNGDFDDWAYHMANMLPFTVELTSLKNGFDFPDDEEKLEQLFQDNLPFMKDLLASARDARKPSSHLRAETLKRVEHKAPARSFGRIQELEAFARKGMTLSLESTKELGQPMNGGAFDIVDRGIVFDRYRARIGGLDKGDELKYRIATRGGGDAGSYPDHGYFVFRAEGDGAKDLLLVNGASSAEATVAYERALESVGFAGRFATYALAEKETLSADEVLTHYPTVIWQLGDGDRDLSFPQIAELSKFIRNGGAFYLSGAPKRTALFDGGEADAFNFFAYDLGIEELIPKALKLPALGGELAVAANDPIFGGLKINLTASKNKEDLRLPLFRPSPTSGAKGALNQEIPLLASLTSGNEGAYSFMEFPIEVPSEGKSELLLSYLRGSWEIFLFVEAFDPALGWTTLEAPDVVRPAENGLEKSCPGKYSPHLLAYFDACALRLGADGKPLLKNLSFRDSWEDAPFDLSAFRGKNVTLRISSITAANFDGSTVVNSAKLRVGGAVKALTPASSAGLWKMNDIIRAPLAVGKGGTLVFPLSLEHVATESERASLLERVLKHLGKLP